MIIIFVFIFLVALYGMNLRYDNLYRENYLSKESTNAIKGIWILFVFIRHAKQYVSEAGYNYTSIGDYMFYITDGLLAQLIVVLFLFFSGYGILCSVQRGGDNYIHSIPKKRCLNTLINFDIAILGYIFLAILLHKPLTMEVILLSFTGLESVGNSNWYIFVILVCYFTTFLSYTIINRFVTSNEAKDIKALLLNCLFLAVVAFLLIRFEKPRWWYDTIMAYPLGMLFCIYRKDFDKFAHKQTTFLSMLLLSILMFVLSYCLEHCFNMHEGCVYWLLWLGRVVAFIMISLLIMMKFKISNKFIVWLGVNLFPLYIYQRLPMILFAPYLSNNPYLFFSITFVLSCALVFVYKKIEVKLI